ncbi:hypothetical protein E2C01_070052 [Portunus trituberculatus]|uniref:Uncharacterized protein n=1 Tax=Portunus trituberculatus TaxID=210409 RepID=A0A5B7I443_PORTR|nr:hypothetical protein [Portunus trituberculatus]
MESLDDTLGRPVLTGGVLHLAVPRSKGWKVRPGSERGNRREKKEMKEAHCPPPPPPHIPIDTHNF